ncbi:conserved hypothethical protein (plasmid) [Ralstonia solanacearum CMR15]|nr:conserved hypothethical protein [Ralstonia solanacearum CMR15]
MRTITQSQVDLIDAVLAEKQVGGLTAAILEKDVHVTEALHAIAALKHPHVTFVFCGGTSLSKAHGLIERMSEDVDLKVVLTADHNLTRSGVRDNLSKLKHLVASTLERLDFVADQKACIARNENRYIAMGWSYKSKYETDNSLRPHLSIELTVRSPKFPTEQKPIGYLVDRLAERQGITANLDCIAVEETLAEKVLSFLRRHAEHRSGNMQRDWDTALVRHIYDTYCIVRADPTAVEKAKTHFHKLVTYDTEEFKRHENFVKDPKACLLNALTVCENEAQTLKEYQNRLMPLVYGNVQPEFQVAFAVFKACALELLGTL